MSGVLTFLHVSPSGLPIAFYGARTSGKPQSGLSEAVALAIMGACPDTLPRSIQVAEQRKLAASLFTGAGIGDIGYRAAGFDFLSMCEIEPERAALAKLNFPATELFAEDVRTVHDRFVAFNRAKAGDREIHLLTCTAPCQGMSKSGQGTLLKNIRAGNRPALDPRNRLILPALDIIRTLRPLWAVFENVIEMRNTIIEDGEQRKRILDILFNSLKDYEGCAYDVEFADYGVPQRRQRLLTVLTRDPEAIAALRSGYSFIPPVTHDKNPTGRIRKWVSVAEAIADFPPLDGGKVALAEHPAIPYHRVPTLDAKKYEWIRHTPPGRSAFDNQCINPECRFQGNTVHGASHDGEGINRSHKDTPLYCQRCGLLLPRPYTEDAEAAGGKRLMSGYTSAYKRMQGDLPAPALTRNLSYPCSDQKLHPTQNRVLSLAEAMRIHTLDRYDFKWGPLTQSKRKKSSIAPDSLIRLVIGESVPPLFFELLGKHILAFNSEMAKPGLKRSLQLTLF